MFRFVMSRARWAKPSSAQAASTAPSVAKLWSSTRCREASALLFAASSRFERRPGKGSFWRSPS